MTELRDNIFAVEVPEETVKAWEMLSIYKKIVWELKDGTRGHSEEEMPFDFECLFLTSKVTEAQAAAIVERERGGFAGDVEGYKEYFKPGDWSMDHEPFKSAIKSLQSLLKSKGLAAGNYLIIKKVG